MHAALDKAPFGQKALMCFEKSQCDSGSFFKKFWGNFGNSLCVSESFDTSLLLNTSSSNNTVSLLSLDSLICYSLQSCSVHLCVLVHYSHVNLKYFPRGK